MALGKTKLRKLHTVSRSNNAGVYVVHLITRGENKEIFHVIFIVADDELFF